MFCREIVKILRAARAADPHFPPVVFVHMGTPEQGEAFFAKRWPEARAIADPERRLYNAFGIVKASLGQVLSPGVFLRGMKAALRGNFVGKPVGDVWQMPGAFLIDQDRIVWSQTAEHAGDHPDLDDVRRAAEAARVARSQEVRSTPTETAVPEGV